MSEEDKKLQKHLVDEMMKVSKTNPDVMFYMEALMKKYEELEQKVEQLEKENKKLKKAVKEKVIATCNTCEDYGICPHSYREYDLENIRKEAIEYINNNNHIDGCLIKWEVADLLNILNKGSESNVNTTN